MSGNYHSAYHGPVLEAAEVVNSLIPHVFENLAAECGATARAAIDDHILVLGKTLVVRGRIRISEKFQQTARDVHGASDLAALFHFQSVAHVDIQNFAWSSSPVDESSVFKVDRGASGGCLVDTQAFFLSNAPVSPVPPPAALPLFAGGLVG